MKTKAAASDDAFFRTVKMTPEGKGGEKSMFLYEM